MDFGVSYFQTKTMFVQVPCETSLHLLTSTVAGTCWCPCQRFVRPWADGSVLKRKFNANFDRCVDHDRKRAEVRLKHLVHAPFCLQLIPDEEYICLSGMFFHYRQLALGCGIVSKCMEHAKNWWWMFFSEWQWQWGIRFADYHVHEAALHSAILSADSNASGCVAMAHLEGWGA